MNGEEAIVGETNVLHNCTNAKLRYTQTMEQDRLDWTLLRVFLAVVDAGSLLGAANRLKSHQPTVSRQIAALEAQLGVPLFERTGRGLTPTVAGQSILGSARQVAIAVQTLRSSLRGVREMVEGSVRVTCSQVMASSLVPECLSGLRQMHPGIHVDLVASNQLGNLLRRDADIALRMVRPAQGSLVARRIGTLSMGIFASRAYLSTHPAPERLSDLARHELVGLDRDDTLIRALAEAGLPLERDAFGLRTDDQVAYIRLVQEGAGIGFIPVTVAQRTPGLQALLTGLAMPTLPVWLAVHREVNGNPMIRIVFDHFAEHLPKLLLQNTSRDTTSKF